MNVMRVGADRVKLTRVSPRPERPPLSLVQQRLWIIEQMLDGSTAYHSAIALRLRGPLDHDAMISAMNSLSRRHEALRTSFPSIDGEPWQQIAPPAPLHVRREDLRHLNASDRLRRAHEILSEEQLRPYDIEQGPLARYLLLQLDHEDNVLAIAMHHLISDAGSNEVICRELGHFYREAADGRGVDPEPLKIQYADYALWQQAMAASGQWDEQLRFWRQHLRDASSAAILPNDRRQSAELVEGGDHGGIYEFIVDDALAGKILQLARETNTTPFMTLCTAFGIALGSQSDDNGGDVAIGVPFDGRFDRQLSELIGMFVNTLAVRVQYAPGDTYRDVLSRTRDALIEAYANSDIPFDRVVRELAPNRNPRHNPLFQVMFQLQHGQDGPIDIGGLEATWFAPSAEQPAKFELMLSISLVNGKLNCEISYATALFTQHTIERFAQTYQELLSAIAANPDAPVHAPRLPEASASIPCINATDDSPGQTTESADDSLEALLCIVFQEALGRAEVAVDDNFFDLGGDSLLAIKVMHRVSRLTRIKVPVKAIFMQPTAVQLAELIANQAAEKAG